MKISFRWCAVIPSKAQAARVVLAMAALLIAIGLWQREPVSRTLNYLVFNGPYLSRTLSRVHEVVSPELSVWQDIVRNPVLDQHAWHPVDLLAEPASRLTVTFDEPELQAYVDFIGSFHTLVSAAELEGRLESHAVVQEIVQLVHSAFRAARSKSKEPDLTVFMRKPYRAENHIFQLVNNRSGCGTVAEATVALLRDLGFATRLMGLSNSPAELVYNHVFVEYFAPDMKKWVMLDPMVNIVPTSAGMPLSAFETLVDRGAREKLNRAWAVDGSYNDWSTAGVYTPKTTVFFDTSGPFSTIYMFASDAGTRENLSRIHNSPR